MVEFIPFYGGCRVRKPDLGPTFGGGGWGRPVANIWLYWMGGDMWHTSPHCAYTFPDEETARTEFMQAILVYAL